MLLATGVVALSRKLADEKAKRQEAKQGHLKIGDSDVAKRAFASQTSQLLPASSASSDNVGIKRAGTDIRYEDPNDISASTPDSPGPGLTSPRPEIHDARQMSQLSVKSPVESESGVLESSSPYTETVRSSSDEQSLQPPPYSPRSEISSPSRPSYLSKDTDTLSVASFATNAVSIRSTNSHGTHAIRIKTVGSDLKSGFPYHPALFDLKVHPEKWTAFTYQVVESTKLGMGDQAGAWAAATAVALTGAIGTSIFLGRSMTRSAQEKKIKAGMMDTSDGGLGETLREWNEDYFGPRGLFVHLELSEEAMKNPGQRSKALRKGVLLYSNKDERERKREERKFVIVVTKLDDEGVPTEALQELELEEKRAEAPSDAGSSVVEIGSSDVPTSSIPELPSEETTMPVELPAEIPVIVKTAETPSGYIEMDSDNTLLLEKMHAEKRRDAASTHEEAKTPDTHPQSQVAEQHGEALSDGKPQGEPPQLEEIQTEPPLQLNATVEGATSTIEQDSTIPQPKTKPPPSKALYDGADWGEDGWS